MKAIQHPQEVIIFYYKIQTNKVLFVCRIFYRSGRASCVINANHKSLLYCNNRHEIMVKNVLYKNNVDIMNDAKKRINEQINNVFVYFGKL